jgi:hypothetical protein
VRAIIPRSVVNKVLAAFFVAAFSGVAAGPGSAPAVAATAHARNDAALIEVQYRSYMEGRDFQSYQQERGFVGERRFGVPDRGATRQEGPSPDPDRPSRLQRRYFGSSDSRCGQWSRRCDQRWGSGNRDYYGCMRYHGCR